MTTTLILFLYLIVGATLAISIVNLTIGFQKGGNNAYRWLGIMGICVSVYILLFSFDLRDIFNPIFSKVALFFFITNFALFPWFLGSYTGYNNIRWQWALTILLVLSSFALLIGDSIFGVRVWNIIGHIALLGIMVYGIIASLFQLRNGVKGSARLILVALMVFGLLLIDDIFRVYFSEIYPILLPPFVLPLDYFLVLFMIVMGVQLVSDMQKKYLLEKSLNLQEKRWQNLLEKVNLLVVGVENMCFTYVNPFFLEATGFTKEEVLGKHFINFIPEYDQKNTIEFADKISKSKDFQYYQNSILTKSGDEIIVSWTIVGMYDDGGSLISSISIGSDITVKENAVREIQNLKSKLEEENILLKAELGSTPAVENIIGESDAIRYVLQRALQVAPTDTNVLLEGETGVGKELVTNYIQKNSSRKDKPFVKINCSAIPDTLFESELFGYLKGSFTGADRMKKGLVEMADGGTLFLDEIGEFPLDLQPKLLRFLQEGEFVPIGSESQKKVDVRIITATNRELLKEIEKGTFRNDLYYRLYVYPITIPALRNRTEDIPDLVDSFLKKYATKHGKNIISISKLVLDDLKKYSWPGNIRELENVIERAVIVSNSETLKAKDLSPVLSIKEGNVFKKASKLETLSEIERSQILKALKQTDWQIHGESGAAEILGINPNTLRSRMKKLSINKP